MADYNLGTARGRVEIDYDGKGVDKAQTSIAGLGRQSQVSGDQIARGMGAAGAIVAAGLGVAVNAAANFEQGLSNIRAVSGATADEMEKIRSKALQIGRDTSFGATDAASAMEELAKAGLSTADILGGAADATVALAAAGEVDLPFAAQIASNAMNQFSLSAAELPKVADLIAGAANASAIDVGEFGQSLAQVGAVANLAGLTFDDTAIAIAEMGNAGIKGSDAGTSLKTMLSNLQPTTKKATAALEEMGIITEDGTNRFYDQEGRLKSLKDIQQLLNDGTKNYTAAQKQAALQTIFGSDAIRAAAVLTGEGAAGYTKMSEAMGKVKAADVAKVKMDNLKGSVEALKGSAETLAIGLGTILLPTIRDIVDGLSKAVNWFTTLSPAIQKTIVYVALGAASFLLFGAALIKVVQFAQAFGSAIKVISTVAKLGPAFTILKTGVTAAATAFRVLTVAMLTNPIGLIIIAVIALIAAIVLLWKNSETFRSIVMAVWAAIKSAVGAVVDWFTGTAVPFFIAAFEAIKTGLSAIGSFFATVWNGIKAVVTFVINLIVSYITLQINILLGIWNAVWGLFGPIITAVFNLIKAIITFVLVALVVIITQYINMMLKIWTTVWNAIRDVVVAIWNFIKPFVLAAITAVRNTIVNVWNGIKSVTSTVWNAIKAVIIAVWNAIKAVVSGAVNTVKSVVSSASNAVKSAISSAWNAVLSVTRSIWQSGFVSAIRSAISSVIGLVNGIRGKVIGALSSAGSWLKDAGRRIIQGLLDGINAMTGKVQSALNKLTGLIPDWKGPKEKDAKLLTENGKLIMQSLITGLDGEMGAVKAMLNGVTTDIPRQVIPASTATQGFRASGSASVAPDGASFAIEVNTYNPVAEKTSETTAKAMTRLSQLGVLS